MFILDKNKFGDCNLSNAKEFVEFWRYYYPLDRTTIFKEKELISYKDELNLKNDLTDKNIKRLLRWKDPHWLTEKILSGPKKDEDNPKVMKVLKELKSLNEFRYGQIHEDVFLEKIKNIYPDGFIWRIFLLHICRPHEYPIADRYVFNAFSSLTEPKNRKTPKEWNVFKEYYFAYKEFFFTIAKSAGIVTQEPKGYENNIFDIITRLKQVDNALFAYGQFLETYNKTTEEKNDENPFP